MSHALIIDDNLIVSRAIQEVLEPLGYNSFECAWTEKLAVTSARVRPPDLVVIADSVEEGSAIDAINHTTIPQSVLVLMVTADRCRAHEPLPGDMSPQGPYLIGEIATALKS